MGRFVGQAVGALDGGDVGQAGRRLAEEQQAVAGVGQVTELVGGVGHRGGQRIEVDVCHGAERTCKRVRGRRSGPLWTLQAPRSPLEGFVGRRILRVAGESKTPTGIGGRFLIGAGARPRRSGG